MRGLEDFMDQHTPGELIKQVVEEVGFEQFIMDQENGDERWGFVQELMAIAEDTTGSASVDTGGDVLTMDKKATGTAGLFQFLEGISLLMSAETLSEDETADAVRLMTLHASKGLEFHTVLITGCEDGLIPFKKDENTGKPEDEETRLFYVGVTRAKRKLFLCRAFKRMRFGKTEYCDPSPFLDVIKDALAPGGGRGRERGCRRGGLRARCRFLGRARKSLSRAPRRVRRARRDGQLARNPGTGKGWFLFCGRKRTWHEPSCSRERTNPGGPFGERAPRRAPRRRGAESRRFYCKNRDAQDAGAVNRNAAKNGGVTDGLSLNLH